MFPPRTVLAAIDFSESSRSALNFATRLARQAGARLHVIHAQDPMLASAARAAGVDIDGETRTELDAFVRTASAADDPSPVQEVVDGQAVAVLCDTADRANADVIVIGTHGMSGVNRLLFGSTTEGVLKEADHSVFVIPDGWTPPRSDTRDLSGMGPVVVGVDSTTSAVAAAHAARTLARLVGAPLELHHVVPPPSVLTRWSAFAQSAQQSRLDEARQLITRMESLSELSSSVVVTSGPIAEQLAEAVRVTPGRSPVLVLGRRTHAERGASPGSIALRVLALADAPVLMYLPDR